jgi:hypothetical protein
MPDITKMVTNKIIELHEGIIEDLKRTVQDAIEIGELLTKQKAILPHGEFLPWIARELPFSDRTARNYMKLYQHKSKLETVSDLQEAYRQIETLERQSRARGHERRDRLLQEREETGEKPEGWDREVDYEYRKKKAFEEREEPDPEPDPRDPIKNLFNRIIDETQAEADLDLDDLRNNVSQKGIFVVIEEYIDGFPTASERLEAVHNLIKKLRIIAIRDQQKSIHEEVSV